MKNKKIIAFFLLSFSFPVVAFALDFLPNTIFLMVNTPIDCANQGGTFVNWENQIYCFKSDEEVIFSDVHQTHPHAEAIAYVHKKGIVKGYDDGTFRPNDTINRVELLKILVESEFRQIPECQRNFYYTDTIKEAWYQRYVQIGSCLGIVQGYPDSTFQPDQNVTLPEASKMISESFQFNNEVPGEVWYEGPINNLAYRGALPTTISNLTSALTRGQIAEIIYRLKSGKTKLATHSLRSLKAARSHSLDPQTETNIDTDIEALFKELEAEGFADFE